MTSLQLEFRISKMAAWTLMLRIYVFVALVTMATAQESIPEARLPFLACEGTTTAISCEEDKNIRISSGFWGRGDSTTCTGDVRKASDDVTCSLRQAYDLLVGLCEGRGTCYIPANVGHFGEPCVEYTRKYLSGEYYCEKTQYHAEMCENSGKLPLSCPDNKLIIAEDAFFGRDNYNTTCPHATAVGETYCSMDTAFDVFKETCEGKTSCELDATVRNFGDPCPGNRKYLKLNYSCSECLNELGDDLQCDLWALEGECSNNADWMMRNCRKSCWKCDDTPPVCENVYHNNTACELWAADQQCSADNAAWMMIYCRRSCLGCDKLTDCSVNKQDRDNVNSDCLDWYDNKECSANLHYMFFQCTKSCFNCDNENFIRCANKKDNEQCEEWAIDGQCEVNPGYMIPNCFKSCSICNQDPKCENIDPDAQCDAWEQDNQCNANPVYMHMNCWKSCMKCEVPVCENRQPSDAQCEYWVSIGECNNNPSFMMLNCSKSCTKCAPVSIHNAECINAGETVTDELCDGWANDDQCNINPTWMIPNCRKSCSRCDVTRLNLNMVGTAPIPGGTSNLTRSMSFVLPGSFPQDAYLTHFIAFFARTEPVYLQIWRPDGGSYTEAYSLRVVPSGTNYAQTMLVPGCVFVRAGDKIGFTTLSGQSSPIAQTHIENIFASTAFRRESFTSIFIRMLYPYKFSLAAGYDVNSTCFGN